MDKMSVNSYNDLNIGVVKCIQTGSNTITFPFRVSTSGQVSRRNVLLSVMGQNGNYTGLYAVMFHNGSIGIVKLAGEYNATVSASDGNITVTIDGVSGLWSFGLLIGDRETLYPAS